MINGRSGRLADNSSSGVMYSDMDPNPIEFAYISKQTYNACFAFSIQIKRYLYVVIDYGNMNRPFSNNLIQATKYRRIGTNS